jgi:hypothetical protein
MVKQNKTRALEEISSRNKDRDGDHELVLREKDEEIEVYKSGMEQALLELEELKLVCFVMQVLGVFVLY